MIVLRFERDLETRTRLAHANGVFLDSIPSSHLIEVDTPNGNWCNLHGKILFDQSGDFLAQCEDDTGFWWIDGDSMPWTEIIIEFVQEDEHLHPPSRWEGIV